jgi:hypothetical protein
MTIARPGVAVAYAASVTDRGTKRNRLIVVVAFVYLWQLSSTRTPRGTG